MRRRLLVTSAAVLAGLAVAPAGASGAVGRFVPAGVVDGADVQSIDLDVARDGGGAVAYVKRESGVDRAVVSRLVGGAWQPPERLDAALPTPSNQVAVAAADGGRLVAAFISGGALYTTTRAAADQPFSSPQLVASVASNPAIDLSINGVAYVSYTAPGPGGGDMYVARKDRATTVFGVVPGVLDLVQASVAGVGSGRSKVAVAADGVALVVWGEGGQVVARRVFDTRISAAPQVANAVTLNAFGGGAADTPDVDVQDDSSFAWVVFRQAFTDGRTHGVARKLVGSQFDAPLPVDGQAFPSPADVGAPRIDINGRGEGYAASALGSASFGAVLKDKTLNAAVALGPAFPAQGFAVPATDEGGDGLIAWQSGDGTVHARAYDNRRESRAVQLPLGDTPLGTGASDALHGLEAGADRAGDVVVAFAQGAPGARSLVAATFDRAPGAVRLNTGRTWRNLVRTPLRWSEAFELWGPVTYSVELDGVVVGQSTVPQLALPPTVPDGVHRWRIIASDRGGQFTRTGRRVLRHDATAPRATIRVSGTKRRGQRVRVRVRATDANPAGRRASGVGSVRIAFGDGARSRGRSASHRYRRRGTYTVTATVRDRAQNTVAVTRRVRIR